MFREEHIWFRSHQTVQIWNQQELWQDTSCFRSDLHRFPNVLWLRQTLYIMQSIVSSIRCDCSHGWATRSLINPVQGSATFTVRRVIFILSTDGNGNVSITRFTWSFKTRLLLILLLISTVKKQKSFLKSPFIKIGKNKNSTGCWYAWKIMFLKKHHFQHKKTNIF